MSDSRFQPGDTVHIHSGLQAGDTILVEKVDEDRQQLIGQVEAFGRKSTARISSFDDACLISPMRRPLAEDILASLSSPLKMLDQYRRLIWLAKRAMEDANVDAQRLMDDFVAFEQSLEPERQAALERRQDELRLLLEKVPPDAQGTWWQDSRQNGL